VVTQREGAEAERQHDDDGRHHPAGPTTAPRGDRRVE
jgi:hypothetical protein